MSRLTAFYEGAGTDSEGRTLAMIRAYGHDQLEGIHDYIQWTRVLTSTRILGREPESLELFAFLKQLRDEGRSGITTDTFRYWEEAATGALPG